MSRVSDLVDLIQGANDTYLANPDRNARSAYIQIDNLCELIIKSWLQMNFPNWSHLHSNGHFKRFGFLINEVKNANPGNHDLSATLNDFDDRRTTRNNFFHNPQLAGLTVQSKDCLQAFWDLYQLMDHLFGIEFSAVLNHNPLVKTQIAVIRLKTHGADIAQVLGHYQEAINQGEKSLRANAPFYEYYLLYENPATLLKNIHIYFEELRNSWQKDVDRIDSLQRPAREHLREKQRLQDQIDAISEAINTCL